MTVTRQRFTSCDPGNPEQLTVETDLTLPEVEVTIGITEQVTACLDATQVAHIVAQLVHWLGMRAR